MKLEMKFSELAADIGAEFEESSGNIPAAFGEIHRVTEYVGGEPYSGEYDVTPKMEEQIMPTKEKVMLDDVTIKAIPIFRVSNTSGGTTVYIANEV